MRILIFNKNNGESNEESIDSIEKQVENLEPRANHFIFSRNNVKSFIYTMLILFGIIGAYYLIVSLVTPMQGPITGGPPPEGGLAPGISQTSPLGGSGINIWPFWGSFSLPTLSELLLFAIIILGFVIVIQYYYGKKPNL